MDEMMDAALSEQRKKKRKSVKTEHFFDFADDLSEKEDLPLVIEEGVPVDELEVLNNYFATRTAK